MPIQARRSAVNESFKVTNAERVVGPASAGSPSLPTETPPPPTLTPSITPPNTATFTPSVTPSITTTPTMAPFDCSLIRATDLAYGRNGRSLIVRFSNGNSKPTTFNRALLVWPTSKLVIAGQAVSQTPYAAYSTLDSDIHWEGNPPNPAPQAPAQAALISPLDTIDSRYGIFYPGAYRTVDAEGEAFWEITFLDFGNRRLAEITFGYDFFGTKFYFQNPDYPAVQPEICEVALVTPPAPPLPTPPPPNFTPSPTHTPDCADNRMRVQFVSFDRNADVRLRVTNNSSTPGYLIGFTLFWPSNVPGLRLSSVVVGGRDANDIPSPNNPNGAGTLVWENTQGATTSPTLSHAPSPSARWIADYIFPPNSITDVHLNFTGYAVTLQALGLHQSVFNGSVLRIACTPATGTTPRPGQGPGGGGPGGTPGSSGDIGFDAVPTPPPTPLPPPTNTPGPTLTPSNTPTRGPATATWTRQPPTMTFTPSPTPAASNTPLPSATPTDSNFGGSDGG
ncbi:MAG: hypothetical protein MUE40_12255 [Anaerolineae bacterium]|nr:hypothetical protein [Anaerolineae bacterium]